MPDRSNKKNTIELDANYRKYREKLIREFSDHIDAAKAVSPILDRTMVSRIFDDDPTIGPINKERLIFFYEGGNNHGAYRFAANFIGQEMSEIGTILSHLEGEYYYYRHFAPTTDPSKLEFVRGEISIYPENKIPCFSHRSHDWDPTQPEHVGFVFRSANRVFLAGGREGVLRLAIGNLPSKSKGGLIAGIVLSTRTEEPHDPFSARFLMIRKDNETYKQMLEDKTIHTVTRHEKTFEEQKCVTHFFELTKGDYSYYMLHHLSVKLP